MQYAKPSTMPCGAWDYLDHIFIRRVGGQSAPSKDIEAVRFITPYGNSFGTGWKFQWHIDITDYQLLLHDSVEIAYIHTGYEGTNVGWGVTITFNFIEGTPVYEPVNITTLWDKNYWWSQVNDSTKPQNISMQSQTSIARVRINHTGHGADSVNYCSEFCPRYRKLNIDGIDVDNVNVWRKCGNNALYPQGGTWVYDRGGWCPGAMVYPYIYDKTVTASSSHTFDMSVVFPFTPTNQGNELVTAHLIECKSPQLADDASIEEILNPTLMQEYLRSNPACSRPQIIIRNNGTNPLTSLKINYGLAGLSALSYSWTGNLSTYEVDTVTLPGVVNPSINGQAFKVYSFDPNGNPDQFKFDDTLRSQANKVVNYINDTTIIIENNTNNYGFENGYELYNSAGAIIKQRVPGTMANNTNYKDTVVVSPGCYTFKMLDTGGDGLNWWANSAQGSGSMRFKRMSGLILKVFPVDFGSEYIFSFTTGAAYATSNSENDTDEKEIMIYPNPAKDYFILDLYIGNNKENISVEVKDALGKSVITTNYESFENGSVKVNTAGLQNGLYFVNVSGRDFIKVKKLVIQ
jgi:hypothetical protein